MGGTARVFWNTRGASSRFLIDASPKPLDVSPLSTSFPAPSRRVNVSNMEDKSESFRPRLFHLRMFALEAFQLTDEDLTNAGLLGDGESLSHFARLFLTYRLPCRRFRVCHTDHRDYKETPQTPRRGVSSLLSASITHLPLRV